VNATDLRNLKYPTRHQLLVLGAACDDDTEAAANVAILKRESNATA
jgi:hypothetical protein